MKPYDNKQLLDYFRLQLQSIKPACEPASTAPVGTVTAVTVDSLIEDVHFPHATPPEWIAHKALAVNLSDLAAMGARPAEICLGLVMPAWDEDWLHGFGVGLSALYSTWQLRLLACHVCKGPLSITIQAHGRVVNPSAMRRSQARPGDQIYVTGSLGDAACALPYYLQREPLPSAYRDFLQQRFNCPEPRCQAGLRLAQLAHAAVDISDGLSADLGHILEESQVGASVHVDKLPSSQATLDLLDDAQRMHYQLGGGDDFELCFTIPLSQIDLLQQQMTQLDVPLTWIGEIVAGSGIEYFSNNQAIDLDVKAYEHFSSYGQEGS